MLEDWLADPAVVASTRNRRAASLGRFFTWAQRQGLCASNPTALRILIKTADPDIANPVSCQCILVYWEYV